MKVIHIGIVLLNVQYKKKKKETNETKKKKKKFL